MRLIDLSESDKQLDEVLPVIGALGGAALRGVGGAVAQGAKTVGQAAGSAIGQAAGSAVGKAASGLAGGGMDPAQSAQAAKDQQEEKKQIQDQIRQTEQMLVDLRKRMAELG
jgi:hypothetical protein